ncbi:MAG: cysteine desulfurase family protein, partial [Bacteroidota bacterium]
GRESRAVLEESRYRIARFIGAKPDEVFFTSGGTEADNHALRGAAHAARRKGKNHIITSAIEHHAVLHSAETLHEDGFEVSVVPVDEHGAVDPDEVRKALRPTTCLISIMHANNEVGTLNSLREISAIAKEQGVILHSDTVQTVGKIRVNVDELGLDLLATSAHKFYGPKGIGAIYIRKGTSIDALIQGGSQESNRRAGTENVPLAAGFAKAAELCDASMELEAERIQKLRAKLRGRLEGEFEGVLFNGHPTESLPHILSVSFDSSRTPLDGEALIMGMDLQGVAVTSGSACTSGSLEPSHVLLAMGRDVPTARATVRFSLGRWTTEEEVNFAVDALHQVVSRMQKSASM